MNITASLTATGVYNSSTSNSLSITVSSYLFYDDCSIFKITDTNGNVKLNYTMALDSNFTNSIPAIFSGWDTGNTQAFKDVKIVPN